MRRRESITDVGITHRDGSGPGGTVALAARRGGGGEDLVYLTAWPSAMWKISMVCHRQECV